MKLDRSHCPLDRAYRWEKERADLVYMTQPVGGGAVETYTWARTLDEARRMAAHLQSLGFEPGSRIGILSKNCAHFIMSDLAIWMAGYASVALYPTLTAESVEYILTHSGAKLLFVGKLDDWESMKPGVPEELPRIAYPLSPPNDYTSWDDIVEKTEPLEGNPTRDLEDMALLCYTSGSTGRPKGVISTFGNMTAAAQGVEMHFKLTPDERQLSYLPMAHSYERAAVECGSLHNGSQVFFAESLDTFAQDLRRARPTIFQSVPRLWLKFRLGVLSKMPEQRLQTLLKIPIVSRLVKRKVLQALGLDQARLAISGSAPIPPELIQWYRDLGLELLEGYAMSENFAYCHISLPGRTRVGYVGDPMPGVECRISEEGEIQIKSLTNMPGYFENEAATAEAFTEDGFLKTGDRGIVDEEGRLRITGRVKELFKTSKGKYIAPAPIENMLNTSTSVEQSCVTGSGHPMPHALVMLPEDLSKELETNGAREQITRELGRLLDEVNRKVESYERLAFIAVVKDPWLIENGFLTPTMKIKRSVLEAAYGPQAESWYERGERVVWEA